MKRLAAVLVLCVCSFLGGLAGDVLFRPSGSVVAQSPPLPPIARAILTESDKPPALALTDQFQKTIRVVSPAVVAVDAIKPPLSDPTAKGGKPVEESGS